MSLQSHQDVQCWNVDSSRYNLWVSGIYEVSPEFEKFYTCWLEKPKAIKNFVNFVIGKLPRY